MDSMLKVLPNLLLSLPLLLVVAAAVLYAGVRREDLGRAATLVILGGSLVLVTILAGVVFNVLLFSHAIDPSGEGYATILIARGLVSAALSTVGWGLILLAVFVDREATAEEGF
ncbi:MAG: hypothetical protein KDD82_03270 [Planctomycetes bacterium]|nr:hypothetical protein [Planctomycetota bacterium]